MITQILTNLKFNSFYNVGPNIEIAKGKNKLPENFNEFKEQLIRKIKYKK
jgi:hypothetical protein